MRGEEDGADGGKLTERIEGSVGWLLCVASLSLSLSLLEPRLIRYEGIGISERADRHLHPVLCCAVLCCERSLQRLHRERAIRSSAARPL